MTLAYRAVSKYATLVDVTADITTHDQILKAALVLFADKGYDATSMREIAQQVDISKPALYYHFDSKEEILRALVDESIPLIDELLDWAKQQTPSPKVRKEAFNRWADIVQRNGLLGFRFVSANRSAVAAVLGKRRGQLGAISELGQILKSPDGPDDQELRICMSLLALNTAGWIAMNLDTPEEEILLQARKIAIKLMP